MKYFLLFILFAASACGEVARREARAEDAQNFLARCRMVVVIEPHAKKIMEMKPVKGGNPADFVKVFSNALIQRASELKAMDHEFGGFVIYQLTDDEDATIRTTVVDMDGSVRGQIFDLESLKKEGRPKGRK